MHHVKKKEEIVVCFNLNSWLHAAICMLILRTCFGRNVYTNKCLVFFRYAHMMLFSCYSIKFHFSQMMSFDHAHWSDWSFPGSSRFTHITSRVRDEWWIVCSRFYICMQTWSLVCWNYRVTRNKVSQVKMKLSCFSSVFASTVNA